MLMKLSVASNNLCQWKYSAFVVDVDISSSLPDSVCLFFMCARTESTIIDSIDVANIIIAQYVVLIYSLKQ